MLTAAEPAETLLELFTRYNQDWWPAHVIAYVLGLAIVVALLGRRADRRARWALILTGALWLWQAAVFQAMYATDISVPLGAAYAVLFGVQGVLLVHAGVRRGLGPVRAGAACVIGWAALAYALLVYPLIGTMLGHGWPEVPLFGMAPCPTTIVTLGILMMREPAPTRRLLVVPILWVLLATGPAVGRGVWEDLGMVVFGCAALVLSGRSQRSMRRRVGSSATGGISGIGSVSASSRRASLPAQALAVRPWANTLTSTVQTAIAKMVRPPAVSSSSTTKSAKGIEASPRGPNHPRNSRVSRRVPDPAKAARTGRRRTTVSEAATYNATRQVRPSSTGPTRTAPKITKVTAESSSPSSSVKS